MKWFKHISDSLDDPFIFDLMDKFGADGYLVFFGVLEIYSREFKLKDDWKLITTRSYLRRKLNKRQDTLVMKCLKHIQNSGKWDIVFNGEQVIIFIPKFTQIIDDWSGRKLRSCSVVAPKILRVNKNKEIRIKNKEYKYSPNSNEFRLSNLLYSLILARNPNHKNPDIQKWSEHINKIIRIDKKTHLEIKSVIEWCQKDSFWQNNILSTEKLREKYDQLFLKMNERNDNGKQSGTKSTKYAGIGKTN